VYGVKARTKRADRGERPRVLRRATQRAQGLRGGHARGGERGARMAAADEGGSCAGPWQAAPRRAQLPARSPQPAVRSGELGPRRGRAREAPEAVVHPSWRAPDLVPHSSTKQVCVGFGALAAHPDRSSVRRSLRQSAVRHVLPRRESDPLADVTLGRAACSSRARQGKRGSSATNTSTRSGLNTGLPDRFVHRLSMVCPRATSRRCAQIAPCSRP
jgi:hypothetical protein